MKEQKEKSSGKTKAGKSSIIVKRIKRVDAGAHGGAWKVAFADFAISMMALFLVLWIMGATTDSQRAELANSIRGISIALEGGSSVLEGQGGNTALSETDSSSSISDMQGVDNEEALMTSQADDELRFQQQLSETIATEAEQFETQGQLEQLANHIQDTLDGVDVGENITIEVVKQGVRVRFQDQERKPLFARGSTALSGYFIEILQRLAPRLKQMKNSIMLSGHSDSTPYSGAVYTNWELSVQRAITARQVLVAGGMPAEQVIQLAGFADAMLLPQLDKSADQQRRIEILILTDLAKRDLQTLFGNDHATTTL
ncbi:MAG: flagellar motor protein MotB [Aeromonas sobria]